MRPFDLQTVFSAICSRVDILAFCNLDVKSCIKMLTRPGCDIVYDTVDSQKVSLSSSNPRRPKPCVSFEQISASAGMVPSLNWSELPRHQVNDA
jgi:hypothetical protein